MPRSSRSGGSRPAPSGARGSHSMATQRPQQPANNAHHNGQPPVPHQQQPQAKSPGLFGQMASTAAGVAVGSSVGHGISSMLFGGGGSSEPAPEAQSSNPPTQWNEQGYNSNGQSSGAACDVQSKDFLRCLDATGNNMDSCAFYLDQLKACQAAARPY